MNSFEVEKTKKTAKFENFREKTSSPETVHLYSEDFFVGGNSW
jgi:hypothetical protein